MAAKLKPVTEPASIDWRAHLRDVHGIQVHVEADKWPTLSDEELRRLGNNILQIGLQVPVVLCHPPGTGEDHRKSLIDGRSRFAALALVLNDAEEFAEH